jgi:hypothetical protein
MNGINMDKSLNQESNDSNDQYKISIGVSKHGFMMFYDNYD